MEASCEQWQVELGVLLRDNCMLARKLGWQHRINPKTQPCRITRPHPILADHVKCFSIYSISKQQIFLSIYISPTRKRTPHSCKCSSPCPSCPADVLSLCKLGFSEAVLLTQKPCVGCQKATSHEQKVALLKQPLCYGANRIQSK